ncbi:MAG: peptidoglycan editing factor PgeF [Terriglobia bacterium]
MAPRDFLKLQTKRELEYLTAPGLAKRTGSVFAFTTRTGGVSGAPYESLNLGHNTSDSREHVRANRARAMQALGLNNSVLTTANQIHGNRVARIERPPDPGPDLAQPVADADALVTDVPGTPLALFFADCVPIFLIDPEHHALGLAHAGWKGTAAGVGPAALETMVQAFGTRPEKTYALVGPSIGPCCYRVDKKRSDLFAAQFPGAVHSGNSLDLGRANRMALETAGVPRSRIISTRLCTSCNPELFFSYRRDRETGRHAAVGCVL